MYVGWRVAVQQMLWVAHMPALEPQPLPSSVLQLLIQYPISGHQFVEHQDANHHVDLLRQTQTYSTLSQTYQRLRGLRIRYCSILMALGPYAFFQLSNMYDVFFLIHRLTAIGGI